jgi:hypothetical protein
MATSMAQRMKEAKTKTTTMLLLLLLLMMMMMTLLMTLSTSDPGSSFPPHCHFRTSVVLY